MARHIEQDCVAPRAGPHEDRHLVCRGLAGNGRLGARLVLLERKRLDFVTQISFLIYYTCWLFAVLV